MWEDFQKVLEKRVTSKKVIKNDKYLIITTGDKVLRKIFGEISKNFVEIKDYKDGRLWVELRNSTWRSEFKLHEKRIIKEINKSLNENLIKNISTS
jgi:hypothetical protein